MGACVVHDAQILCSVGVCTAEKNKKPIQFPVTAQVSDYYMQPSLSVDSIQNRNQRNKVSRVSFAF